VATSESLNEGTAGKQFWDLFAIFKKGSGAYGRGMAWNGRGAHLLPILANLSRMKIITTALCAVRQEVQTPDFA